MTPPFASPFDAALAAYGPAALYTLDPEGKLRVDPERTREIYLLGPVEGREEAHYVLTDTRTGLRLYLYVTHPAMAERQPRGSVVRYPTAAAALEVTRGQWGAAPRP